MNLDEMRYHKKRLGLTNEKLAQLSGVPVSTVAKIMAGITLHPRYFTRKKLEKVLEPPEGWEMPGEDSGTPENFAANTETMADPVDAPEDDLVYETYYD